MDLEKMLTALRLCREPADENNSQCKQCPYREYHDRLYSCIDKRSEDLEKLILWAIAAQKVLREFTGE